MSIIDYHQGHVKPDFTKTRSKIAREIAARLLLASHEEAKATVEALDPKRRALAGETILPEPDCQAILGRKAIGLNPLRSQAPSFSPLQHLGFEAVWQALQGRYLEHDFKWRRRNLSPASPPEKPIPSQTLRGVAKESIRLNEKEFNVHYGLNLCEEASPSAMSQTGGRDGR